jgi:hypothetical protein
MMDRRTVLAGIAAGIALPSGPATAALRCGPFDFRGVQLCEVGIDSRVRGVSAQQRNSQWCWAACISGIFAYHGCAVSQRRIVAQTYGHAVNLPAHGPQIAAATSQEWETDDGNWFSAECEVLWDTHFFVARPDAAIEAARELADDNPLIVGATGHAMVLTAMTYARDVAGNGQPLSLTVRDPWPGRGRRQLSPQEWAGTSFLAKVII